jgi:hypothetical protein
LRAYAIDTDNLSCKLKIDKQVNDVNGRTQPFITLGMPFFRTFYTVFDVSQSMIGFGLTINSYGKVLRT